MNYTLITTELKGQNVQIKTNIGTLKEVWNILKEVNLDGLLTGGNIEVSFIELIDNLLLNGKLNRFIHLITSDLNTHVDELELSDIVGIVTFFFTSIAQPFQGLSVSLSRSKVDSQ